MDRKLELICEPAVALSKKTCDKLVLEPDGNAARLWLLLASEGQMSAQAAAVRLSLPASAVSAAYAALARAGLCSGCEQPDTVVEQPATADDIVARKEGDAYFAWLLSYAEQTLGRTLTPSDTVSLMRVCDRYGLMAETVPLLLRYCAEKADPDGTTGRRATMYQVEKAAALWEREGIDSPEKADAYLRSRSIMNGRVRDFLRGLNIFSTTPGVERTVESWLGMDLPEEVLQHACDLAVARTGALKWSYADSIIRNWQSKGLRTLKDISQAEGPAGKKNTPAKPGSGEELERRREQIRRNVARAKGEVK